jgi:hypothetical protein
MRRFLLFTLLSATIVAPLNTPIVAEASAASFEQQEKLGLWSQSPGEVPTSFLRRDADTGVTALDIPVGDTPRHTGRNRLAAHAIPPGLTLRQPEFSRGT